MAAMLEKGREGSKEERRERESVGAGLERVLETVAAVLPDQFRWTADTNCFSGLNRAALSPTPFSPISLPLSLPLPSTHVPRPFFLADQSARFNRPEMFSETAIFCCRRSLVPERDSASIPTLWKECRRLAIELGSCVFRLKGFYVSGVEWRRPSRGFSLGSEHTVRNDHGLKIA